MTPSFCALVNKINQGRPAEACREIDARYRGRLIRLAAARMSARLRQKCDPEDVVQSVFGAFFHRVDDGRFELRDWESLWGLLSRITVCRICRYVELQNAEKRKQDREVLLEESLAIFDREPTPDQLVLAEDLQIHWLKKFSDKYRAILELHLLGTAANEIAGQLNTSISTVERVIRRGRESLLEFYRNEESQ